MVDRLLIAASWHRSAVFDQFLALGRSLHETGTEVHWLDDRRHDNAVAEPWLAALHQWPGSGRPQGLAALRYAHQLIREVRPDVVIANFGAVTPLGIAARRAGVSRRVCWYHSVSEAFPTGASLARRVRQALRVQGRTLAYRSYTDVVAVSTAAADDYTTLYGGRGPRAQVRHNAVTDGPHRTAPADGGAPLVVAGRLEPWKGIDVLVRAAAQLDPARRVLAMGEGSERAHLTRLAEELGVDLDLPGDTAHHEVREHMAEAAVVVVPSRAEAFGMVAIEGLSGGAPIVASDVGGLPEVVRPGETGFLVPPDDPDALAAALASALEPARNRAMGAAARADFLDRFESARWGADLADRFRTGRPLSS